MSRVINNTFWLMLAQIGGLVIPLIELPILARALGQQSYGQVLYALSIALIASVFIEFGFNFSAARNVVKYRDNTQKLSQLVSDVLLAKFLLGIFISIIVAALILFKIGETVIPNEWFFWILLSMFSFGFTPIWYYIGIEKLIIPALLDLALRSLGVIFIIIMISSPEDAFLVLVIQAIVGGLNTILPTLLMIRKTGCGHINIKGAITVLRESLELFLYKSSQSIMGSIASTLLGVFGGSGMVGAFVPAEKLVRASSGLSAPLLNAFFPYLVRLHLESFRSAKKIVNLTVITIFILTFIFSGTVTYLADWLVALVFGQGYHEAAELLKILIWILPLRICSMALAILWFIVIGKENVASKVMILNVVIICLLASFLVPILGTLGMCIAFLVAEIVMFSILLFLFYR
ncbi:oligosaccharide flippase family protein [Pasteurella testudinis]|nr:oligosaccharide flippase family protein [Pasteurella testudinis]